MQENSSSPSERRRAILEPMKDQFDQGFNCKSCQGYCCTYQFNSMQVTPIEALDLYQYLKSEDRIDSELSDRLQETIKEFRLDYAISTGKGTELRRSYTCPFFQAGFCTIDPEYKPYGCLAFNPKQKNVSRPGHCSSQLSLLEQRENSAEEKLNDELRQKHNLYWKKESIPVALLNLIKVLE